MGRMAGVTVTIPDFWVGLVLGLVVGASILLGWSLIATRNYARGDHDENGPRGAPGGE